MTKEQALEYCRQSIQEMLNHEHRTGEVFKQFIKVRLGDSVEFNWYQFMDHNAHLGANRD